MSLLSRLFSNPPDEPRTDQDSAMYADFLREAARPKALDPEFDSLLAEAMRWEIAPKGTLDRLPLTEDQREQYDFVAICDEGGENLYLLDSRPVWAPGIPYLPSFLVVSADAGLDTIRPIGTFDSKPENWVFAWRREGSAR